MYYYGILDDLKHWLECKQTRLPGILIEVQEVLDKINALECEHE